MTGMLRSAIAALMTACVLGAPHAQVNPRAPFEIILDSYVRDGYVYYRALQIERPPLDMYVASLDVPQATVESWSKPAQEAFWLNAYNALVLRTVIDHYPIKGRSTEYPANSVRQIPGAFDQAKHRVGGRTLTLDDMEKTVIAGFGDARLLFALGRGAIGSGRLRSEMYRGDALSQQLEDATNEFITRPTCLKVNRDQNVLEASPLFSWRQDAFIASFASGDERWKERSPIERAILNIAFSRLYQSERETLSLNTFQLKYGKFDWRLNDLTGGMPNSPR
jgi:hypothetical protein